MLFSPEKTCFLGRVVGLRISFMGRTQTHECQDGMVQLNRVATTHEKGPRVLNYRDSTLHRYLN